MVPIIAWFLHHFGLEVMVVVVLGGFLNPVALRTHPAELFLGEGPTGLECPGCTKRRFCFCVLLAEVLTVRGEQGPSWPTLSARVLSPHRRPDLGTFWQGL